MANNDGVEITHIHTERVASQDANNFGKSYYRTEGNLCCPTREIANFPSVGMFLRVVMSILQEFEFYQPEINGKCGAKIARQNCRTSTSRLVN